MGVVLRFPLPLELTLLAEEPCGDLDGSGTCTTFVLTLDGVREELCHAGPTDGPGRFAAPLMVSRFTVAEGDLARAVATGDLDRAVGPGDLARVVPLAGDLALWGPRDDRELRLEVDDPRELLFGGDLISGMVYAGADTVEPKLDRVLGGSLLCACICVVLLLPVRPLLSGCCHFVAPTTAGSVRELAVGVGVVGPAPRLGLRPDLVPDGVRENPPDTGPLLLLLPLLPRGVLVLRRRSRPRSVCSTIGDAGGSGASTEVSIAGGMEDPPSLPDRPNVPVGVRARGRPWSTFEFNSCATTGFCARLLAVMRAGRMGASLLALLVVGISTAATAGEARAYERDGVASYAGGDSGAVGALELL